MKKLELMTLYLKKVQCHSPLHKIKSTKNKGLLLPGTAPRHTCSVYGLESGKQSKAKM